jgi:hypothetical protein
MGRIKVKKRQGRHGQISKVANKKQTDVWEIVAVLGAFIAHLVHDTKCTYSEALKQLDELANTVRSYPGANDDMFVVCVANLVWAMEQGSPDSSLTRIIDIDREWGMLLAVDYSFYELAEEGTITKKQSEFMQRKIREERSTLDAAYELLTGKTDLSSIATLRPQNQ